MKFFGDTIAVLCLRKNFTEDLKQHFSIFENKIDFELVDGIKNSTNEGDVDVTLWKILQHSTMDNVSIDILQNHLKLIQTHLEQGTQNILIMEEDARFPDMSEERIKIWKSINQWLENNPDTWDIFYFGYCNWPLPVSFFHQSNIVRLFTPLCAHAYCLNRNGMQKILNFVQRSDFYANVHFDKLLTKVPGLRKYGAFPALSFQATCPALYVKACDMMNKNVSFQSFSKFNERVSVILPFIFILLLIVLIYIQLSRWNKT